MDLIKVLSAALVIIGAAFIVASLTPARKTLKKVPVELQKKWLVIIYLMYFFFAGYVFFDIVLTSDLRFPVELVTGSVFFGGAIFVFIIINLSQKTILRIRDTEEELKTLNETLEQRVAERTKELQRSHEFSNTVLNSMSDPISIINVDTFKIVGVNSAFLMEYGLKEEEVIGKTCYDVTHHRSEPCAPPDDVCPLMESAAKGSHATAEHLHYNQKGEKIYEEILTSPIWDGNGRVIQVVHSSRNINERKQSEEQIRFLAYYDNLTGLPNRTFYKELLTRALTFAERHNKIMAVLFVDLDSFKRINDTLGHDAGDQLLRNVADRLLKCVRKSDYVARSEETGIENTVSRLGGDEFIVLLTETTHDQDAARVALRVLGDLSQPFMLSGHEVFITASIGISLYPSDGADVDSLLRNADIAMYHVKEQGKNNYQFYSASMNTSAFERLDLENKLHRALEGEEFLLYYQPKLEVRSGKIIGVEAFIRWNHPERGVIEPSEFIPLAEETGLILPIGEWVLRTACAQNKAWQDAGLLPMCMSVNLSRLQFGQKDLVQKVTEILDDTGLDPRFLELEITESAIIQNPDKAVTLLKEFKAMGIKISLDDFGTGYSSLDYLRGISIDNLKIDRTFIMNIATNPDDAAITKAIVDMAHSLKLKIVAEGVETEDQLAFLRKLGCDEAQGYLFSRPLAAEECIRFISSASSDS